jgi:uncharacterized protein RhaS with RHS repeats
MQARYYDPVIGRFYSNDPVGFRDIHSFNRYAYANNNPYKYVDPTGESSLAVNGVRMLFVPAPGARVVGVVMILGGLSIAYNQSDGNVFEQDNSGKIKNKNLNADDIADDDVEDAIEELEGSVKQRNKENDKYPKGNPNGSNTERQNNKKHKGHKDRIKKEEKMIKELKERNDDSGSGFFDGIF